jgi:hypothetical protein
VPNAATAILRHPAPEDEEQPHRSLWRVLLIRCGARGARTELLLGRGQGSPYNRQYLVRARARPLACVTTFRRPPYSNVAQPERKVGYEM